MTDSATATNAIEVKDLKHSYGDFEAVKDVSFHVAPGEILGFLGPNGAGKSTTIKVLSGQVRQQAGEVKLLGMDRKGPRAKIQARINVAFEEKNLYDDMTAEENLRFFAELYGVKDVDTDALLKRVGLDDRKKDRAESFSKGMRQRLMVARCLVNKPDILFLDEPTDGLDPVSARSIRQLIRDEAARGCAVMLTTHDMHEADELSDRVAFISKGVIVALDSPTNLKREHGKRLVKIEYEDAPAIEVDVDDAAAVSEAMQRGGVVSVHTEEATLEDIFVAVAGQSLMGGEEHKS